MSTGNGEGQEQGKFVEGNFAGLVQGKLKKAKDMEKVNIVGKRGGGGSKESNEYWEIEG